MIARYEGWPGTGLRLEDREDSAYTLDAGGTHGASGGMELFICAGKDQRPGAQIELTPEDVARLASHCNQWLAWHLGGRKNHRP
jgi:hypothetical protein